MSSVCLPRHPAVAYLFLVRPMSIARRTAAVVALALVLCPRAYAPIFGGYPGLRSLIDQSDVIAAITILQQLSEEDFGGSARYNVQLEKMLKGDLQEQKAVIWLRHLEIETPKILASELQRTPPPQRTPLPGSPAITHYFGFVERLHPFLPSSRWIVFLARTKNDKEAAYENVNCMGSTFPLSPLTDLDVLKVHSLPDTLILLFRQYVDFKRNELKNWEDQLDAFIHEGDK
jgi:hypothetical protein